MLSYVLAGLSLGSIYAIAAGSLVITYVSSGIFNLAFAAMAFTVARFYYFLDTEMSWGNVEAAVVALLVFAPLLGMALYATLFRHLRHSSPVVKLMVTVGLSVALPPLVGLVLGGLVNVTAPGLAPRPLSVVHIFGAVVNADQLVTYAGLVVVLIVGVGVLRFTDVGLKVRALVDSEALTGLSGTNPGHVALGVWAASATLAGLAGILIAPTSGLSVEGMTYMMSAAFAAVVAARLRSLPVAVVVALVMGVVTLVVQRYLDASSQFTSAVVSSVPFAFMLAFLLYYALRGQTGNTQSGAALDVSIRPQGGDPSLISAPITTGTGRIGSALAATVVIIGVVVTMPAVLDTYWTGLLASGIALAIALLSYTLVTGEGGMVWLSQITFAGAGAVLTAELVNRANWDPLVAVIAGPLVIVPVGVLLGLLTIRLGNLYVALVTLTFGSLIQTLVLTRDPFYNFGSGQPMSRPAFAEENASFTYLALATFLVLAFLIINVRRSTVGLAMNAVRWSENGARTLGISIVQTKVLVSGLATYVAAVGGGFFAMSAQSTLPDAFHPSVGLVWLAVLVTMGARSIIAALIAGIVFLLVPALFSTYLPSEFSDIPVILFGLGAVGLALHPEGVVMQAAHACARVLARRRLRPIDVPGNTSSPVSKSAPSMDPGALSTTERLPAGGKA
ncbi:ABC transporter permease [Nocardia sp. NPDC055165]